MFKQYRRKAIAELRLVTEDELDKGAEYLSSVADLANGSPKPGDRIARNPKNHNDLWLVAEQYFNENFEEI